MLFERKFVSLAAGSFASTTTTYFLLLSLTAHIYQSTGSNLNSASIFAVSWILPILLVRYNAKVLTHFNTRNVLTATVLGQAVIVCALINLFPAAPKEIFFGALALRGGCEGLEKTARIARLKAVMEPQSLERANSTLSASTFAGIAAGSLAAAFASPVYQITTCLIMAVVSYLLTAGIYLFAPKKEERTAKLASTASSSDGFLAFVRIVRSNHLLNPVFAIMLCTGLFQGFHNVARTAYGVEFLQLPVAALSYLQLTATAAVIIGALFVGRFVLTGSTLGHVKPFAWLMATALAMQVLLVPKVPVPAFAAYFLFFFLFELSFLRIQNLLLVACPKEQAVVFFSWLQALMTGGMAICVFIFGLTIDKFSLQATVLSVFVVCFSFAVWSAVVGRRGVV